MSDQKYFTYAEALQESKTYFNGNELAAKVFIDKYALRNNEDQIIESTPDKMHDRLAKEFARIDYEKYNGNYQNSYDTYFDAMKNFARIVPQGSPMAAIGNTYQAMSASNCVVVESPVDSMGGILDTAKELSQLFKRRCVEENSLVSTKEAGLIPIKDVEIGMHILSFNLNSKKSEYKKILNKFYSEVNEDNKIILHFNNGSFLKTSKLHPILSLNENYEYIKAEDLENGTICIKPELQNLIDDKNEIDESYDFLNNKNLSNVDIGWFIGAHMGDGSCDIQNNKYTGYKNKYRFRCSGDNEYVIKEYAEVFNKLTLSKSNYHTAYRNDYKVDVWEYSNSNNCNKTIIELLFDNQYGKKTYTGKTPSYIVKNNLWWSYLAGIIDTDGHVRAEVGTIAVKLCSFHIINDLACFLSSQGISYFCSIIPPRDGRENEKISYGLSIHTSNYFFNFLAKYLRHSNKKKIISEKITREFSNKKYLTNKEVTDIFSNYEKIKETNYISRNIKSENLISNNFSACVSLLRKDKNNKVGLASINEFVKNNILSYNKKNEITQRIEFIESVSDTESEKYIDLEVEDNNNFYAGNFGLINIHNCGVGVDISTLRPEGMFVNNAAKTTSGAWSFADLYSYITRMVGQFGRRAALMITFDIHHPDVMKFITMKHDLTKVTGANISLRLSNEFLKAVDNDDDYELRWPVEGEAKIKSKIKAKEIWNLIVSSATKTAEPGLIMWDNMINNLPAHSYEEFKTISTNPCSEIALSKYDSCRLISINLTGYVLNAFTENCFFDFVKFTNDVKIAQKMADNLIDLELELINKIKSVCSTEDEVNLWHKLYLAGENGRRTGLGTHGLADALAQLRLRYDGEDGLKMIDSIYRVFRDVAYETSIDLASERGSFPVYNYEKEENCEFIKRLPEKLLIKMKKYGRRNIALLTQAPTGSVSLLSKVGNFNSYNVSSGLEPVFRLSYTKRKKISQGDKNARVDFVDVMGDTWQEFKVYHSNVDNYFSIFPDEIGKDLPEYFVTSDKINWEKRVKLQGVEQQYIDHSISSTINLPKGTGTDVVSKLYLDSWKQGLKGVTVYVDGSRDGVLITDEEKKSKNIIDGRPTSITPIMAPKRPKELQCDIHHATVKGIKWTVLVGLLECKPYEFFMGKSADLVIPIKYKNGSIVKAGKSNYNLHIKDDDLIIKNIIKTSGDDESAWATRMISMSLRHGISVKYIVEQLSKDGTIVDVNNVLARILRKYLIQNTDLNKEFCQKCKIGELIYEEKCKRCLNPECLWSGCS